MQQERSHSHHSHHSGALSTLLNVTTGPQFNEHLAFAKHGPIELQRKLLCEVMQLLVRVPQWDSWCIPPPP